VLLTGVTEALLRDNVGFEYVGEHGLKDFPRPEALFHLVMDGRGAGEFPALRTAISRPTISAKICGRSSVETVTLTSCARSCGASGS
jgi:hypothetical protein